jgi:hypothetical protein
MSEHSGHGQYVRRVVLPSGRAIEVVYFESMDDETVEFAPPIADLHVCPECDRDLVYPVEWEEVSGTHWEVLLRCPNCEWTSIGDYDQATVDRFDRVLDDGTELLLHDLKRLERANMEDEIVRFSKALEAGAILPEDF